MSNYDTDTIDQLAEMFKALSNPNRLRIFLELIDCCPPGTLWQQDGECCAFVGDLTRVLEIVPSTVSHHMKALRQAGLIKMRRRGKQIVCWVDPAAVQALVRFFNR
ncbi:ArsR/SmtB family transcription factor [Desulfatitalea alkaliphila]|uniref:Metalloregulator ArsR/SmtB family transcription factor n=1 Tax=Desulfatitalea alkaliphila TaxID=2929485 RepID=A0AA41QZX7_9BACT|nr:metalloregulator ArsR/SmtB family transcription factor [Desulfatitalea alkaliphila]MCJ8499474.1 metalloregulator ArsR/SmtB family transcription factor [Desulfatitalea alkaliphila]